MKSHFLFFFLAIHSTVLFAEPTKQDAELRELKSYINSCPAAKRLLEQVKADYKTLGHTVKLSILSEKELNWPAQCLTETGEIQIQAHQPFLKKVRYMVFELSNLSQRKAFEKVDELAAQRKLEKEAYVYEVEKIEYRSSKIHNDILSTCKLTSDWDKNIAEFKFNSFLSSLMEQERGGHADGIREHYDNIQQNGRAKKQAEKQLKYQQEQIKTLLKNPLFSRGLRDPFDQDFNFDALRGFE